MDSSGSPAVTLNRALRLFFGEFVRISLSRPALALYFARTVFWQGRAARERSKRLRQGLLVPPIVIFSITNRCNLRCRGCYAQAIREPTSDALSSEEVSRIIGEAGELGVSFIVVAGGEPLLRPEIVEIALRSPRIVFLLVTNGMLLAADTVARLRTVRNIVPVLSIEGTQVETDDRRGAGVHRRLVEKMAELKAAGVLFSLSLTVTRGNFATVTDAAFVRGAMEAGCRFFLYLEYTPIRAGTEGWAMSPEQREEMSRRMPALRSRFRAVFVAVPWDEEEVGGCLAGGRGFVHVNAVGGLEPCPFAPYSDASLKTTSFARALGSPFLAALREGHARFEHTSDGCSLYRQRGELAALLGAQLPDSETGEE